MSGTDNYETHWDPDLVRYDFVLAALKLWYPAYFDPESPEYVDPDIMEQLFLLSEEARPWCLSEFRERSFVAVLLRRLQWDNQRLQRKLLARTGLALHYWR